MAALAAWKQKIPSWRQRLSIIRSAFQKAVRRGEVQLALQCARLYVAEGKSGAILKNLLLFVAEDMSASPQLLFALLLRVEAIKRSAKNDAALRQRQLEIYQLVEWVADPRWCRSRQLPLLACRSLQALELQEAEASLPPFLQQWCRLDRALVESKAEWRKQVRPLMEQAGLASLFRLLEHRLAVGFALLQHAQLLPQGGAVLELPPQRAAVPPIEIPVWPEWVFDKHTMQGRQQQRGIQHFLEEGALVVNAAAPHASVQRWVEEGRQRYFVLAEQYGVKGAKAKAILARLARERQQQQQQQQHASVAKQAAAIVVPVVPVVPKRRSEAAAAAEERAAVPKRVKKAEGDFQAKMRAELEPRMPAALRGLPWLQPLTSGCKRPVIACGAQVWKGPFARDWPRRAQLQQRQAAMVRAGVCVPAGEWQEHEGFLWWVMEKLPLVPLPSAFPEGSFPEGPQAISQLVAAGVAKLALGIGDRAVRNMQWDQQRQCIVAIDLEDSQGKSIEPISCDPVEFCFSAHKVAASFKALVLSRMRQHRAACCAAVAALSLEEAAAQQYAAQVCARLQIV